MPAEMRTTHLQLKGQMGHLLNNTENTKNTTKKPQKDHERLKTMDKQRLHLQNGQGRQATNRMFETLLTIQLPQTMNH